MAPLSAVGVPHPSRVAAATSAAPPRPGAGPTRLVVAGCGVVGRAFLRAAAPFAEAGEIRVVAVSDRSGTLHDPAGLDPRAVADAKEAGGLARLGLRLLPFEGAAAAARIPADVVVDLASCGYGAGPVESFPVAAGLAAGRDAVTAAKCALALFPVEVEALRSGAERRLLYSATVAGGVPLLETLRGALRGSGLLEVAGAWNATSTFVLSRVEEGATVAEALEEARRRGFAERDASADLDGSDAAAKAAIVSAAAFDVPRRFAEVARSGLEGLDVARLRDAARRGRRTRLVARVTAAGARVSLETLAEDHPLAAAEGESAVSIRTALAGTVSLRGPGAGGPATASAVLNDVLSLVPSLSPRRPQPKP